MMAPELVTSGSRGWSEYYSDTGALFIRAADLKTDVLELSEAAFVEIPKDVEGSRTRVSKGDVLITITGANLTKTGLVESELGDAFVSQHVGLVRPADGDFSTFLYLWVVAYGGGRGYLEKATYGAGKPGLSLQNLPEMPVALPPIAEQRARMALAKAGAQETGTFDLNSPSTALRQSILAAAFRGELAA
jgi:type I restriction enzyme S subunit